MRERDDGVVFPMDETDWEFHLRDLVKRGVRDYYISSHIEIVPRRSAEVPRDAINRHKATLPQNLPAIQPEESDPPHGSVGAAEALTTRTQTQRCRESGQIYASPIRRGRTEQDAWDPRGARRLDTLPLCSHTP